MKDEIKEILDKLKNGFCSALTYEKLLDYITNLQEENERLKTENKYFMKRNVRLHKQEKELLIDWHQEHNEAVNYKSRNEKAIENIDLVIELIKQQPTEDDTWILNKLNGFKYLLQGEDKDVKN